MATANATNTSQLTLDGQLIIGYTAGFPVSATLTAPMAGLTITPGPGSITFALAGDLAALEGLTGTGIAVRSAVSTWVQRSVVAGSAKISVTNGDGVSGNISVDTTISGFTWVEETTTSRTLAAFEAVIANNASLVTLTLPTTAAVGDEIRVVGKGAGGFRIAQNAGESIRFIGVVTTTGVGGYLESTSQYDAVHLACITADNDWIVVDSSGNLTYA